MKLLNSYFNKYALWIFAILTFLMLFTREPFYDETHAYDIACLKLSEIFYLARIEGHPILWYLILKPFTYLNIFPYSMLIINWIFCYLALFILWKRAPFSVFIKTFITFSTPFVFYFATVARCYSIGILFLFLICIYYPKRFKNSYLFSTLILLCANTNLMMTIGCFYLSLIYLYELYQRYKLKLISKNKLIKTFLILFLCALLLILQFVNLETSDKGDSNYFINLLSFYLLPVGKNVFSFLFRLLCATAFYYLFYYLFKNSKKVWFFTYSTFFTLTFVFYNFYSGHFWNYYSYFVYFIVLFWIFRKEFKKSRFLNKLFVLILFLSMIPFSLFDDGKMEYIFDSNAKEISQIIKNSPELKNKKLYDFFWWDDIHPGATRYLAKDKINVYDVNGDNKMSFEAHKNIFKLKRPIDFDEFAKNLDENSLIILPLDMDKADKYFIYKAKNNEYLLKEVLSKPLKKGKVVFKAYKVSEI